jgi:hypothetical protein
MRLRGLAAGLIAAALVAGCGSSSNPKTPPPTTSTAAPHAIAASKLEASMRAVLVNRYKSPQPISIQCNSGTIRPGQSLECNVISSAGQGYQVRANLPCWTASFNGTIIEGPGFLPPSQRPKGPVASGPDNLPNKFSGCVSS